MYMILNNIHTEREGEREEKLNLDGIKQTKTARRSNKETARTSCNISIGNTIYIVYLSYMLMYIIFIRNKETQPEQAATLNSK